mgnify:CR=1 FL=1
MNTQIAIQESDLELIVSEKTLGSLTSKANQRYGKSRFANV